MQSIDQIEAALKSPNKTVRLKALKLMLRHPDATPLQLVQGLCSPDNRNFEFSKVFELHAAMKEAWKRLAGRDDEAVYSYLMEFYRKEPTASTMRLVRHILELLKTPRAASLLKEL